MEPCWVHRRVGITCFDVAVGASVPLFWSKSHFHFQIHLAFLHVIPQPGYQLPTSSLSQSFPSQIGLGHFPTFSTHLHPKSSPRSSTNHLQNTAYPSLEPHRSPSPTSMKTFATMRATQSPAPPPPPPHPPTRPTTTNTSASPRPQTPPPPPAQPTAPSQA